jgi:hypothetical protein
MKIRVGKLRGLIREALESSETWGEFKAGDWVRLDDGRVLELVGFKPAYAGSDVIMAVCHTADGTTSRRADAMLSGAQKASPEEIQQAQAGRESERQWMAKSIDTSREGT